MLMVYVAVGILLLLLYVLWKAGRLTWEEQTGKKRTEPRGEEKKDKLGEHVRDKKTIGNVPTKEEVVQKEEKRIHRRSAYIKSLQNQLMTESKPLEKRHSADIEHLRTLKIVSTRLKELSKELEEFSKKHVYLPIETRTTLKRE